MRSSLQQEPRRSIICEWNSKWRNVALDWHVIGLPSCTSLNRIDRKRLSATPQACLSRDLTAAVMTRIIRTLYAFAFATFLFVLLSQLHCLHTSLRRKTEDLLRYSHIPGHYFLPLGQHPVSNMPTLQVFTALTLVQSTPHTGKYVHWR